MSWYYVRDGQQDGPHTDENMRELARAGVIQADSSVWREGMANWQPLGQAAPHLLPAGAMPAGGTVAGPNTCSECGREYAAGETVQIRGQNVCAACKPTFLQKLQEGVSTGGRTGELQRLLKIARAQRAINLGILAMFGCYGAMLLGAALARTSDVAAVLAPVASFAILGVTILQMVFVFRLASALGYGTPLLVVFIVLMLIGCLNLILLLVLSSQATKQLRAGGFRVGLLGGNPRDVERALAA